MDGQLLRVSPSLIDAFDTTTPFGCERRGYLKYVMGFEEPESGNLALGSKLHALNEAYLLGEPIEVNEAYPLHTAMLPILADVRAELASVEVPMTFKLCGIDVRGRIDVLLGDEKNCSGVLDWKTTSDFRKYAKKPDDLKKNSQMLIYAEFVRQSVPASWPLRLEHAYVQTKGRVFAERVPTTISKKELADGLEVVKGKIEKIKEVVAKKSVEEVTADRSKCRLCPFYNKQCPKESDEFMDFLLNDLAVQKVVPEDAPKDDNSVLEDRVGPTSGALISAVPVKKSRKAKSDAVTFTGCTIALGTTINTGNYNNVKLDIAISANISGDFDAGYEEVHRKVKEKLVAAMSELPKGDKK